MTTFYINGQKVTANKNDTILSVARREGFYIPTLCYLTKVKPISSCRLCVVEVEGQNGFILSCQTPPVEGINVITDSQKLFTHRQNIMKMYDVNHPLECGVCDKSGNCDLQNKTLDFEVSSQEFSAKEQKRVIENWGFIKYDESLCILCERCVHVCNEVVGDNALKIGVGGYKSRIVRVEDSSCSECGECMAVCPVGALTTKDFQYKTNAWELQKIPATCAHCSSGCQIFYEVKHVGSCEKSDKKVYRVTNDVDINSLCGAGRFAYDFNNSSVKDKDKFEKAIEAFHVADTIVFNSYITNEEALILQRLKEKFGYKLINSSALKYQKFLQEFSKSAGSMLYNGTIEDIKSADFAIVLGSKISSDNPIVKYALNTAQKNRRAEICYLHPIQDEDIKQIVTQHIKYEVGSEEGVVALLLQLFLNQENLEDSLKSYIDELDIGYLSAESNIGEEELSKLKAKSIRKQNFVLVIGEDLITHKRAENIAKLIGLFQKYTQFKVIIIPTQTNTLGVSLICDLDEKKGNYSIGYNVKGNFTLSCFDGDLSMPSLNQQEGTFTTIDKRVVPTNVAISYNGYCLNDIANAIGLNKKYTIDYTIELPHEKGFIKKSFDELSNFYNLNGDDNRGYALENKVVNSIVAVESVEDIGEFNGTVVYRCESVNQFNYNTFVSKNLANDSFLIGSNQFAIAAKIGDGDEVEFSIGENLIKKVFKIDKKLKGTIAMNPSFDRLLSDDWVSSSYRYQKVTIKRVEG
ncbi:MAG: (2Fe-2S)-binding protein [Campylobacterales bacterium]|nr:(2Fe-2S)-binding protein [Campylobacterales bacterium]